MQITHTIEMSTKTCFVPDLWLAKEVISLIQIYTNPSFLPVSEEQKEPWKKYGLGSSKEKFCLLEPGGIFNVQ